ncbi:hypothetical protein [Thalassobellus suaedae]|uniref:Uncharacterized protein n=1 Tax=Thalassobellus suaedae TaxID=3074124 RepID=A0ABY9XVQ8_9FLAO|nr:hypothetical protein RHP51_04925 [Flavobacteriaceae bacterium HL-DH14]
MEERNKEAQIKSQNDIQSAQAASQSQIQAYGIQAKIDLDKESKLAEIEMLKEQALQQIKLPEEQRKFQQDVILRKIDAVKILILKSTWKIVRTQEPKFKPPNRQE